MMLSAADLRLGRKSGAKGTAMLTANVKYYITANHWHIN